MRISASIPCHQLLCGKKLDSIQIGQTSFRRWR